jgi:tight adherence protein C
MMIHAGYRSAVALLSASVLSLVGLIMGIQGDASNALLFSCGALVVAVGIPFLIDRSLHDQIQKRRIRIQLEFPEFINKLTLLVNAGMTIPRAWEKIVNENKKASVLYAEMAYTFSEIKAGKPEALAYEEFAMRCKVKEVTKVVSVIVINLRRGGAEVVATLRQQGSECWEMRKAAAKQLGEEASTKILLPLMIMFFGIFTDHPFIRGGFIGRYPIGEITDSND